MNSSEEDNDLFLIQENSDHPINDLVSSPPNEFTSLKKIERSLHSGELSRLINVHLPEILQSNHSASVSSESVNEKTTSLTWRIARSNVTNFVIKILKGLPHNESEPHFLTPNDTFIYFYGEGECEAVVYEYESVENYNSFESTRKIKHSRKATYRNGDSVMLHAGNTGLQILSIDGLALFELSAVEHHDIVWNFDTKSNAMLYPSAADVSSSRLETAMDVLKSIGDETSIPIIAHIARNHHQHFVRWSAIETMSCLSLEDTEELLRDALNDPHHEIRAAAHESLALNGV